MNCQSICWSQRSKGFKLKQGLKLALLLAVGVWLLYQLKQTFPESKGYGKSANVKVNDERGSVILGRKGNAGSKKGSFALGSGKKDDGGTNELSLEESSEDGNVLDHNSLASTREEDIQKETETPDMASLSTENVSDVGVQEKNNASKLIEEFPREDYTGKGHDYLRASKLDHDEMEQEPEQMKMPPDGMENSTDSDQQALLDGVHGFHDENGIPELGNNHLISVLRDYQENTTRGTTLAEEAVLEEKGEDGNVNDSSISHLLEATKEEH